MFLFDLIKAHCIYGGGNSFLKSLYPHELQFIMQGQILRIGIAIMTMRIAYNDMSIDKGRCKLGGQGRIIEIDGGVGLKKSAGLFLRIN